MALSRTGDGSVLCADADTLGRFMVEVFERADAFLLGRTTYQIFAAHWPRVADPTDPIAAALETSFPS